MKKISWKAISEKLKAFPFTAIKEINDIDFSKPSRTVAVNLNLSEEGLLSCWSDDLRFIEANDNKPMPIYARFIDKRNGDYILLSGESQVAAVLPGKGALLHIRLTEEAGCLSK